MVAKLLVDVKAKIRLQSFAGATALAQQFSQGDSVISVQERKPNPILLLPTVSLNPLLAYIGHDGASQERGGYIGEFIFDEEATQISEGAIWTLHKDGTVVQFYSGAVDVLSTPERVKNIDDLRSRKAGIVVSDFENGILGVNRAMQYAATRVLTNLEAFHNLVTLSDRALEHAIGSNLKGDVSVSHHRQNIAELEALVRSGSELAEEIRGFLEKLKDPKDRRKRHNAYRMVLIVRAVQRRAKEITEGKSDTLEAITLISLDVARYIGAVTATAAQISTELRDEQPWWTGDDFAIGKTEATRRRKNFVLRLQKFRTALLAIGAKPFRCWTFAAANRLENMASFMEKGAYAGVLTNARYIVALMEAVLVREAISRCVIASLRGGDDDAKTEAINIFQEASEWYYRHRETLGLTDRARPIDVHIAPLIHGCTWKEIETTSREVERLFDKLLD